MIYKVFYQENKERNPRRETTKVLYVEVEASDEREGRIKTRKLVESKKEYNIEFITLLDEKSLAYEKETGVFKLAEL